jgi:phage tail sheath gpL-like
MSITPSSWAAGVGVAADNKQFATAVEVLTRKHLLVGSYDPAILTIEDLVPRRLASPADATMYGEGSMLHRMALAANAGSYFGVETWALPVPEDVAAVQATGTVVFGGGPAASAGRMAIWVGGTKVSFDVAVGDVVADIGAAFLAAVNAIPEIPVVATGAATVTLTAKPGGTFGNYINVTMGWGSEQVATDLTVTITEVGGVIAGATDPDIDDALTALGTGDSANWQHFTDVNFGWGIDDDDVLDAISTYNGVGNEQVGLYSPMIGRPFRSLYKNWLFLAVLSSIIGFQYVMVEFGGVLARTSGLTQQQHGFSILIGSSSLAVSYLIKKLPTKISRFLDFGFQDKHIKPS